MKNIGLEPMTQTEPKYHLPSPLFYIIISLDYDANIDTKI